nr:MAG TPA: hypothetical protein [Caudoviricetes sp.]
MLSPSIQVLKILSSSVFKSDAVVLTDFLRLRGKSVLCPTSIACNVGLIGVVFILVVFIIPLFYLLVLY